MCQILFDTMVEHAKPSKSKLKFNFYFLFKLLIWGAEYGTQANIIYNWPWGTLLSSLLKFLDLNVSLGCVNQSIKGIMACQHFYLRFSICFLWCKLCWYPLVKCHHSLAVNHQCNKLPQLPRYES